MLCTVYTVYGIRKTEDGNEEAGDGDEETESSYLDTPYVLGSTVADMYLYELIYADMCLFSKQLEL